jgi:uncharacterized protein YprB with RNaseH-like and TPR domain
MSATNDRDLRRRLARLGRRGARHGAAPMEPLSGQRPEAPDEGLAGEILETPQGPTYYIESRYPIQHAHGSKSLASLLAFPPELAAQVAHDAQLADVDLQGLAFVDTETTGLSGGAGTLVFLVGLGHFVEDEFVLRQYFLREPAEEPGMLTALRAYLDRAAGFVTFNGRAFDLPLLEMRYMLGLKQSLPITSRPHLDLLHPSRRLWRRELPDCRLGTLETRVLGIVRTDDDVPGSEIPGLYLEYLRTGKTHQMRRVVYHNAVDILSLVGLATEVLGRFEAEVASELSPSEALAVARWHERAGRPRRAEAAYREAAAAGGDADLRREALRRWGRHLKRQSRYVEAAGIWESWHALAPEDPIPCIELAKQAEWRDHDLQAARRWAEAALVCLSHWPDDWRREQTWRAIEHRLTRLARKQAAVTS